MKNITGATGLVVLGLVLIPGLAAFGCSSGDDKPKSAAAETTVQDGQIAVVETDMTIGLNSASTKSGKVVFTIKNAGPSDHNLIVFRTDLGEGKLPLNNAGTAVNEDGPGITHIDETQDMASGVTASPEVKGLAPGKYVLICNLTGHYQSGMYVSFTVT